MDVNEYYEENKRFVHMVGAGVVVFFVAFYVVDGAFADKLAAQAREETSLRTKLNAPMYTRSDLDRAEADNEALQAALATLRETVEFRPRPQFVLDPGRGSASSQYLEVVSGVRDALLPLANRANLALVSDLGLPELSPTQESDIVRYLEAVDIVDRVVRLAIDAGVARIDSIRITLDPAIYKRGEPVPIERTRVQLEMHGPSLPLARVLETSQRAGETTPLLVTDVDVDASSAKTDEARMDVTFAIARLHEVATEDAEEL